MGKGLERVGQILNLIKSTVCVSEKASKYDRDL
jgi:hypothetical protein